MAVTLPGAGKKRREKGELEGGGWREPGITGGGAEWALISGHNHSPPGLEGDTGSLSRVKRGLIPKMPGTTEGA